MMVGTGSGVTVGGAPGDWEDGEWRQPAVMSMRAVTKRNRMVAEGDSIINAS
jgi:hypothetical protein